MSKTPRLPVPDLNEMLERYLQQVQPLLTSEEYQTTVAATRYFKSSKGKAQPLQAALQAFDGQTETSWLAGDWLESYLSVRGPLPLSSNVGFAIQTRGKDLSQWTHALASVCADHYHKRIPVPQTPQDTPVCMNQWAILKGAARIPQHKSDGYRFAQTAMRHIGVLHNGFYYRIAALDEQFEAYHPDTFRQAFQEILADRTENPYPVTAPCYFEPARRVSSYQALRRSPENARLLDCIEQDLFHISLTGEQLDADTDLAKATFQPDQNVWSHKPTTYCYNTVTNRFFLHCEHSWQDGGALKGIIERAAAKHSKYSGKTVRPDIERCQWQLTPARKKSWKSSGQAYTSAAKHMRVSSTTVPFNGRSVPKGTSHDALMQFLLQYAQLSTYGNIRNTYEAVDASHFQHGRTECVRPVSQQSLAFVGTLLQERPDRTLFQEALAEHKARIKAAKLGRGPNRHLLGLRLAAARNRIRLPAFFKDKGYQTFNTDFISSSTLGDDTYIRNFAFAPTSPGGLGVNYTLTTEGWLFTVSHTGKQRREVDVFLEALKLGGSHLLDFLNA